MDLNRVNQIRDVAFGLNGLISLTLDENTRKGITKAIQQLTSAIDTKIIKAIDRTHISYYYIIQDAPTKAGKWIIPQKSFLPENSWGMEVHNRMISWIEPIELNREITHL